MKKITFILLSVYILISCSSQKLTPTSVEFQNDFASENNRIAGQLSRKVFNRNLESLTYDYYLEYLRENLAPSADGIFELIVGSDEHYFKAKKSSFLIALYYFSDRTIVCDISNNGFIDSVSIYDENEVIPTLEEFVGKINY